MHKVICFDLVRTIIEYIPLENLRILDRAHAIFAREICAMGIQVFYGKNEIMDLTKSNYIVIATKFFKDVLVDHCNGTYSSLVTLWTVHAGSYVWTDINTDNISNYKNSLCIDRENNILMDDIEENELRFIEYSPGDELLKKFDFYKDVHHINKDTKFMTKVGYDIDFSSQLIVQQMVSGRLKNVWTVNVLDFMVIFRGSRWNINH